MIIALLHQPSLEKAVASMGISLSTAYRMRRHPDFQAEYLQAQRELVSEAIARLQQGCNAAATTLLKIMLDPNNPAASRLRAAERVIEHAKKLVESQDRRRDCSAWSKKSPLVIMRMSMSLASASRRSP